MILNVYAGGECSAVTVNCEGVFKGCCTGDNNQNDKHLQLKISTFNGRETEEIPLEIGMI